MQADMQCTMHQPATPATIIPHKYSYVASQQPFFFHYYIFFQHLTFKGNHIKHDWLIKIYW